MKNINKAFGDSFPAVETIYSIYGKVANVSQEVDNTLRRCAEMTVLEILELIVVASHQTGKVKRETLRLASNKVSIIKVFIDLAVQTSSLKKAIGEDILKDINHIEKLVTDWTNSLT